MSKTPEKQIVLTEEVKNQAQIQMMKTGDGSIGLNICHMIQSRFRVLYLQTAEERRAIEFFTYLANFRGATFWQWDCDRGLLDARTKKQETASNAEVHSEPTALLAYIIEKAKFDHQQIDAGRTTDEKIILLLDFHEFLEVPQVQRKIKEFSDEVSQITLVIVSPVFTCPPTLEKYVTLLDFPVPSKAELKTALGNLLADGNLRKKLPTLVTQAEKEEEELIQAVSGLSITEAENAFAMSIVKEKKFNIKTILNEKRQTIRKSGVLEYCTPRFTMDQVGGLGYLKEWLVTRKLAFKEDAREFGLPAPKGVLILSPPGCGKSMICSAIASMYEMPYLKMDFGSIFSAYVGDSEKNLRLALKMAEAISPAVLQLDEIEKAIGGGASSNQTDGGVTGRVIGTTLTWMQDKVHPVFIVATANSIKGIPPEFMRAGRFDEIFFIDLPGIHERMEIASAILIKKGRNPEEFDTAKIANKCPNYTAVEIEKGIDNALFVAFAENKRKLTTDDILEQLSLFHPLYDSRKEEIEEIRKWALGDNGKGGRAVLANSVNDSVASPNAKPGKRVLDVETFVNQLEI